MTPQSAPGQACLALDVFVLVSVCGDCVSVSHEPCPNVLTVALYATYNATVLVVPFNRDLNVLAAYGIYQRVLYALSLIEPRGKTFGPRRKRTNVLYLCATFCSMPNPYLLFCPYLPVSETTAFADWELGPLGAFEDRWANPQFQTQATAFLRKFLGTNDKPIKNPALLCRKGKKLDGKLPSRGEVRALDLSLAFSFIDCNSRYLPENQDEGWERVTTDNAELYLWAIDLEQGRVTINSGFMVVVRTGGYRINDDTLVLRPPLGLHMPPIDGFPDPLVLTGIYKTVLGSLRFPGENTTADQVRVALEWFSKAWRNTATLHCPERLVFLKTAFEALTGTSKTYKSACRLRKYFEELPDTTARNSKILVWSPTEKCIIPRSWRDRSGQTQNGCVTDLENWFMEFGKARNTIIHEGKIPRLMYSSPNTTCTAYNGNFVFTAEFLLRVAIKVLLSTKLGYKDVWLPECIRAIETLD